MKRALLAALAIGVCVPMPAARAEPPVKVCKQVNAANVCRNPDGSVTACGPLMGCQPVYVAMAPGFWDDATPEP